MLFDLALTQINVILDPLISFIKPKNSEFSSSDMTING